MRIPDWLVYATVLIVIVSVLFIQDSKEPIPEYIPADISVPDYDTAEPGPTLPAPNPFDEKVLVQVGEVEDGIGTAFAINGSGVWLTARHVVDGCREVGLAVGNGRMVPVKNVARSDSADLALLYTDRAPRTVPVAPAQDLHVGDRGYHFGFPQGRTGEVVSHLLARNRLVTRGRYSLDETVLAWVEAKRSDGLVGTLAGMSGGPVFNAQGEVIGVTVAESPRRGRIYTAAPSSIFNFLEQSSATTVPGSARPIAETSYSREADRMRQEYSVVKVICRANI